MVIHGWQPNIQMQIKIKINGGCGTRSAGNNGVGRKLPKKRSGCRELTKAGCDASEAVVEFGANASETTVKSQDRKVDMCRPMSGRNHLWGGWSCEGLAADAEVVANFGKLQL